MSDYPNYLPLPLPGHAWDREDEREAIHAAADAVYRAYADRQVSVAHRMFLQLERLIVKAEQRKQVLNARKEKAA